MQMAFAIVPPGSDATLFAELAEAEGERSGMRPPRLERTDDGAVVTAADGMAAAIS